MKQLYYYPFQPSGTFTGTQATPSVLTSELGIALTGSKASPGNVLKLAAGDNAWAQQTQTLSELADTLNLSNLLQADWTPALKVEWVMALCRYVGCYTVATDADYVTEIVTHFDTLNLFQLLSGAGVAYVSQDANTQEISIGVSMATFPYLLDYATITTDEMLNYLIRHEHQEEAAYVSHLMKIGYLNMTKVVYCFGGDSHPYTLATETQQRSPIEQLMYGGGSVFGEVKMAGSGRKENYLIRKNVDMSDPTGGLYSGVDANLSVGDDIYLLDNSTYTNRSDTDWTWFGDYNQVNYTWFIAEITYPQQDFPNLPANYMNFPIEVIEQMTLDDFEITKLVK